MKIKRVLIGISALFLVACGSSTDDNSNSIFDNTASSMKQNIIGTWESECLNANNISTIMVITFTATEKLGYENLYSDLNCSNLNFKSDYNPITYTIGEATTSKNGENSVELNFTYPDNLNRITYSMVRTSANKLYIANNDILYGGETVEERHNDFSSSIPLTKK